MSGPAGYGQADSALNIFIGRAAIVAAVAVAWFGGGRAVDKIHARSWPVTAGVVLASDMYERTGRSHDWCMRVDYRYTVAGVAYRSRAAGVSTVGAAGCDARREVTAARLARAQPGAAIDVRYDPADPARAALAVEGFDVLDWLAGGITLALVYAGWRTIRQGKRQRLTERRYGHQREGT